MDSTIVDQYVARLEASLQDPTAFEATMQILETDKAVRQQEAAGICKRFYGDASSSTSKREAMRRIRSRHTSLMDFLAKSEAQAGKSAA